MKISKDQKFVEHEGIKGKFAPAVITRCIRCCFFRKCDDIPCSGHLRKDNKDGYFKLMEVKK